MEISGGLMMESVGYVRNFRLGVEKTRLRLGNGNHSLLEHHLKQFQNEL